MSDQHQNETTEIDAKDRGLFDCFGKKEENPKENVDKVEEEKLYLNSSSSSSSSEEEVEEDGVKIKRKKMKKKKGLTDKIKEKLPGHKDEEAAAIPVSNCDQPAAVTVTAEATQPEEKKGFLEMIKEKLPGHHKDEAVAAAPAPAPAAPQPPVATHCGSDGQCGGSHEVQEKKGFLEKIKDKFPGGNKDSEEAKKDH